MILTKYRSTNHRKANRRGIAFLAIVVMLLLIVTGATHLLVRGELTTRRHQASRIRVQQMSLAIDVASDAKLNLVSLPLDPLTEQRIEVTRDQVSGNFTARWLRSHQQMDILTRQTSHPKRK